MSAEHKRPLVAFVLVALVCSSIVGQSVRSALLGNGIGLGILVPIAPAHLLDTIHASGANGRYLDTPFLGTAISAVGDTPEPTAPEPTIPGLQPPAAPSVGSGSSGSVVQVVATRPSATTAPRAPRPPKNHHKPRVHIPSPRDIGSPPPVPTGPTTLQTARDDLHAARVYASQARSVALQTTRIARLCFRVQGKASCEKQVDDAEEAAIRADAAAAQVNHVDNVVQHLLGAIDAFVAPVRVKATRTFTARVETAQAQFGEVREQVRSNAADFQETTQDQWSDALADYRNALDKAGTAAHRAADQRLREVTAYAKNRQATVRRIQHVYEQKLRSGNVAAARAYRKQALADLAVRDGAFAAKIGAERDSAAAAYGAATGAAKEALDRTRAALADARAAHAAEVAATLARAKDLFTTKVQTAADVRAEKIADAQALAEATVVVDPATLPDPGAPAGDGLPADAG
jgi:hypothetical protein